MGFRTYALMISVALWGVLMGGVVYSHVAFFPAFLAHLPESASVVSSPYAVNDAPFWTFIHPLLILSIIISLATNWRDGARRNLILFSFAAYAIVLIATFVYFVPELFRFMDSQHLAVSADEWQRRAQTWITMSYIRGVIVLICFAASLIALARPAKFE